MMCGYSIEPCAKMLVNTEACDILQINIEACTTYVIPR